jgi:AraC-like DNA-binding protein
LHRLEEGLISTFNVSIISLSILLLLQIIYFSTHIINSNKKSDFQTFVNDWFNEIVYNESMIKLMYSIKTAKPYMMVPVFTDYTQLTANHVSHYHIHPVYHIVFMISGECRLENNSDSIILNERDIVLIDPMKNHIFRTFSDEIVYFAFNFKLVPITDIVGDPESIIDGSFTADTETAPLESIIDIILKDKKIVYNKSIWQNILSRIQMFHNDVSKKQSSINMFDQRSRFETDYLNRCMSFFTGLYDDYLSRNSQSGEYNINSFGPIVRKIIILLERDIGKKFVLDEIAEELGYNSSYLSSCFKQKTGTSLSSFAERLKIQKACDFLKYTEYSITEIAHELGYSSTQHFSRNFRKTMNMTPNEYRFLRY